jgi:formate hydrogenlyase subunit 3/multisubunit Na+/H+ antiporter MnhD subunit
LSKYYSTLLPIDVHEYLPSLYGFIGLALVLKSFSERRNPTLSWLLLLFNSAWITIAISFNDEFNFNDIAIYLSGIILFGTLGFFVLKSLKKLEPKTNLNQYNGHIFEHPKLGFLFLVSSLGIIGFPISPTFIGIDLIFNHIHQNQFFLASFIASSYILSGISVIRLYSRLFLGIHIKTYHEYPYKSA